MNQMTMFTAWMIFSPEGLPLLYTLSDVENAAWIAAWRGTGRIYPPLEESGYRAVKVSVAIQ